MPDLVFKSDVKMVKEPGCQIFYKGCSLQKRIEKW